MWCRESFIKIYRVFVSKRKKPKQGNFEDVASTIDPMLQRIQNIQVAKDDIAFIPDKAKWNYKGKLYPDIFSVTAQQRKHINKIKSKSGIIKQIKQPHQRRKISPPEIGDREVQSQ